MEHIEFVIKLADEGNIDAQCELGNCYYQGKGVPRSVEKAAWWWAKAARQGDAQAQFNLAGCCYEGTGVPRDISMAKMWCHKAAAQGHEGAIEALKDIF